MILTGYLFQISIRAKGHPGARLPAALPTLCLFGHCAQMKCSRNNPFNLHLTAEASSYPRHVPSRGIGGEPKRSEDSPPRNNQHDGGQTDKSEAFARRAAVPSGGNAVNITEDVRKYAAEPSGARQIIHRMTLRASRAASQQAISEEEALQRGMDEKSKELMEAGAKVYSKC